MKKKDVPPKSMQTPYSKAHDDEKVSRNWRKARGLYKRGEYSVAVIRCSTCIELAVNFAIRQELVVKRHLPLIFVDKLLHNANGLRNKYNNIFFHIMPDDKHPQLKKLWKDKIDKINTQRNAVVHSGEFRTKKVVKPVMEYTLVALKEIMGLYEHSASLDEITT